jgi:hypothetical protein
MGMEISNYCRTLCPQFHINSTILYLISFQEIKISLSTFNNPNKTFYIPGFWNPMTFHNTSNFIAVNSWRGNAGTCEHSCEDYTWTRPPTGGLDLVGAEEPSWHRAGEADIFPTGVRRNAITNSMPFTMRQPLYKHRGGLQSKSQLTNRTDLSLIWLNPLISEH